MQSAMSAMNSVMCDGPPWICFDSQKSSHLTQVEAERHKCGAPRCHPLNSPTLLLSVKATALRTTN